MEETTALGLLEKAKLTLERVPMRQEQGLHVCDVSRRQRRVSRYHTHGIPCLDETHEYDEVSQIRDPHVGHGVELAVLTLAESRCDKPTIIRPVSRKED